MRLSPPPSKTVSLAALESKGTSRRGACRSSFKFFNGGGDEEEEEDEEKEEEDDEDNA